MGAGDVFRVGIGFTNALSGKGSSFSMYGRQAGAFAPDITSIGDDVKAWWTTGTGGNPEKNAHGDSIALARVTLRRIKPLEPVELEYTSGLPIAGSSGDTNPPEEVALLISLRTANIGRSYRGRVYLPGVKQSSYDDDTGRWKAAEVNTILDNFVGLQGALNADRLVAVVWSPKLQLATDVSSIKADLIPRSQRRRNKRVPEYQTP